MKILHCLKGKADPNTMNGVNKVVHYLASYGEQEGLDVEVWGIANTSDIRHEHTYSLRLFPPFQNRFLPGTEIKEAISELNSNNTVFHMHSVFLPELYTVSRLLKKKSIPWVLTPHAGYNAESMKKNRLAKHLYMMLFERKLINQSRALHAISNEEESRLLELASSRPVVTIPNGQEIIPIPGKKDQRLDKQPIFVFCGRLDQRHKGLDLLLEGFSKYCKHHGAGILWIIGDGPHKSQLVAQVKNLQLNDSVVFLGPLFGGDKIDRLAEADVFVHTSRWDVLPTAVLEAAAVGLPAFVSRETGLGHIIEECKSGYVLPSNTPEHIATALSVAENDIRSGESIKKSKAIKNMIVEHFDWSDIVNEMNTLMYTAT